MSAKAWASFSSSSSTILAAFTFKTTVSMTEMSSSRETARLTKRFKARLSESETSGGLEGWVVSLRGRDNDSPLWPEDSLLVLLESIRTGGAVSSARPFSSKIVFGVGAGGQGSLDCLSHSR